MYKNYNDLRASQIEGLDYAVSTCERNNSRILIVAPHGGTIEPGTSEITRCVANNNYSSYIFESRKEYDENYVSLHITSHKFDEPRCIEMLKRHDWVVTVHGCSDLNDVIFLGGLCEELKCLMGLAFTKYGINYENNHQRFLGRHPDNICNRGKQRAGLQLEISVPLRKKRYTRLLSLIIKEALNSFLND